MILAVRRAGFSRWLAAFLVTSAVAAFGKCACGNPFEFHGPTRLVRAFLASRRA
jgi:hypothetical protein